MDRIGRIFCHLLEDGCPLQSIKRFVVASVGGATGIANLRWKFSKNVKLGVEFVPNTLYGYY